MLEAPHVLLGIAIASKAVHPALAVPLSFASHFVLDMVPHWNPHLNTEMKKYGSITKSTKTIILVDALASAILVAFFVYKAPDSMQGLNVFLSAFAAIAPDVIEAPYFFFHWKNKFLVYWLKFQKSIQTDASPFVGVFTQIVVVLVSLWWILS